MKRIAILAAAGAPVAVVAALAAPAFAAPTKASFRVEGASKTLLPAKSVTVPTGGSITKGGTPKGTCPANSAAGAFNVATGGNWSGTYSSGLGILVTKILGESAVFSKGSLLGVLRRQPRGQRRDLRPEGQGRDQLLFAYVPAKGAAEFPIVISAPAKATAGTSFQVKASYYPTKSNTAKPLAGVSFTGVTGNDQCQGRCDRDRDQGRQAVAGRIEVGRDPLGRDDGLRLQVADGVTPGPNRNRRRRHRDRLCGLWLRARCRRSRASTSGSPRTSGPRSSVRCRPRR